MAPKERLPIKDMPVGETKTFHWKAEGFRDFSQMYHHIGNRCSKLKANSPRVYSMMRHGETVMVRRHK